MTGGSSDKKVNSMKQTTKEAMLARIRAAIANAAEPAPIPYDFQMHDERERTVILTEFIDRLVDYKALVTRVDTADLAQTIADTCQQHSIQRLVVPADLPANLLPPNITVLQDDPPLTLTDLDQADGVLTGCAMAIAQTGTIILDGGATQGRRVLSLVPDQHLCVVYEEQVVGLVPEAVRQLQEQARHPITLISGPSATSDIELSRVEGVHGPRTLHVFIVNSSGSATPTGER
jgi:L-lactate dehydrogenase complex protein LldG